MSRRFEYRRLTGQELADALEELDFPAMAFCRIFGVSEPVMKRWLKDEQDIPPWVFVVVWLLREIPEGIAIARTAAAHHIVRDSRAPQLGEYPYLDQEGDDDESL